MSEAKFKIGDRVRLVERPEIEGVVTDVYGSTFTTDVLYEITADNDISLFRQEGQLEPAPIIKVYSFEAIVDASAAVVTMFDVTDENAKTVVSRGHAHILHDGEVGMAQAVSFAARRMFEALDAKGNERIYVGRNGGSING